MRIFKMPTSTEDRFSRGLSRVALVLGGVVLSWATFGYAVESFGWLTGLVEPPAEVLVPTRGEDLLVEYSAGVAWSMFLVSLFFSVLFSGGTVVAALEAVGIFRRARTKARLARQWKRHAGWHYPTEGPPVMWPEQRNDPRDVPPGPGTRV